MRRAAVLGVIAVAVGAAIARCTSHPEATQDVRRRESLPVRSAAIEVTPPPPGTLRLEGLVLDDEDRVVAGARVVVVDHGLATTSGEDGGFVFEHLGAARYRIAAARGDALTGSASVELDDASEPVVVHLRRAATAMVHVIDAETHAPIANAAVGTARCPPIWACAPDELRRRTDATGSVLLRGLPQAAALDLEAAADGYEPGELKVWAPLVGDPFGDVTIELHRGVAVGGVVRGPHDEPVSGAVVFAVSEHGEQKTRADANGVWQLPALAAGTHRFRAFAAGFLPRQPEEVELGQQPRNDIVVRVDAGVEIAGIVVDQVGQPVTGAGIDRCRQALDPLAAYQPITSGSDGRFHAACWPEPGRHLRASKGPMISESVAVDDDAPRPVDVRLVLATSTIAGRVVDSRGRPVPRARIIVRRHDESASTFGDRADRAGRFELPGIAPGTYDLAAEQQGELSQYGSEQWSQVATGARDVTLVVRQAARVSGRLVLDGTPVMQFRWGLAGADDAPRELHEVPAADGRFELANVTPGTWHAVFVGPGFARTVVDDIVVEPGRDVTLGDVVAVRGLQLRGRVTDTRGTPVAGAMVMVHESGELYGLSRGLDMFAGRMVAGVTDAAGGYVLDGISPPLAGDHVVAEHPLGRSVERMLGERDTTVDLVIAETGGIDGVVVGIQGDAYPTASPVGDASLEITALLDRVDHFRFDNVAPGDYVVRLPYGETLPVRVHVAAGQRTHVRLEVPRAPVTLTVHVSGGCRRVRVELGDTHDLVSEQECDDPAFRLPPGTYRVCIDDRPCRPVVVAPEPSQQAVGI